MIVGDPAVADFLPPRRDPHHPGVAAYETNYYDITCTLFVNVSAVFVNSFRGENSHEFSAPARPSGHVGLVWPSRVIRRTSPAERTSNPAAANDRSAVRTSGRRGLLSGANDFKRTSHLCQSRDGPYPAPHSSPWLQSSIITVISSPGSTTSTPSGITVRALAATIDERMPEPCGPVSEA